MYAKWIWRRQVESQTEKTIESDVARPRHHTPTSPKSQKGMEDVMWVNDQKSKHIAYGLLQSQPDPSVPFGYSTTSK